MNRRSFNKTERTAIYLAADGKSEISGEPLADDWQADHVIPWSKGGITDVSNAQAATRLENLRKSNSMNEINLNAILTRHWQRGFFDKWQNHELPDFLLAALPAAARREPP